MTEKKEKNTLLADSMLRVSEVAEFLKISKFTLYSWIETGKFPSVRVGRMRRVRRSDLEKFLEERTTGDCPTSK